MIMNKEWMLNHGKKQMSSLIKLYSDELAESNPRRQDFEARTRLFDAINFHDTVLCLIQILPETFDEDLKRVYNKIEQELNATSEESEEPANDTKEELNVKEGDA